VTYPAGTRVRVRVFDPDHHTRMPRYVRGQPGEVVAALLGPSPGWYKSFAYRSRTVREPRAVLAEFGVTLPDTVQISVWDSTSEARYMVLPARPAGSEALDAEQLTALVTRNGLIGTALV
jgi:nitrile hydratase subunit alpha